MASSGMLRRVALVITDVSGELSASFIRVTRIGELGTTLAVTSDRRTLRRNTNTDCCHPDEGGTKFLRKSRILQEPQGVTSQKTQFFIGLQYLHCATGFFFRRAHFFPVAIANILSTRRQFQAGISKDIIPVVIIQ
jgi:hypothetical protein